MVKILFLIPTKNTPLGLQHKGRKPLEMVYSVHSPMQNLLGKTLHLL